MERQKQMRKIYVSPIAEICRVVLETGIALSVWLTSKANEWGDEDSISRRYGLDNIYA